MLDSDPRLELPLWGSEPPMFRSSSRNLLYHLGPVSAHRACPQTPFALRTFCVMPPSTGIKSSEDVKDVSGTSFTVALVQLGAIGADKTSNLAHARSKIAEAVKVKDPNARPDVVVLPEIFNSPYGPQHFDKYAEVIGWRESEKRSQNWSLEDCQSESVKMLSNAAAEHKIWLFGGWSSEQSVMEDYRIPCDWLEITSDQRLDTREVFKGPKCVVQHGHSLFTRGEVDRHASKTAPLRHQYTQPDHVQGERNAIGRSRGCHYRQYRSVLTHLIDQSEGLRLVCYSFR